MGLLTSIVNRPDSFHFRYYAKYVGILRECKNRWECRTPLTPENIMNLKREYGDEIKFVIQPSKKRIYKDALYSQAGAEVSDDLSKCDLIMGIKEIPSNQLIPNKSLIFFSHTHKGQDQSMKMLKKICDLGITLYDYELLKENGGKRMVAFGKYAGYAGMLTCLHGIGDKLLSKGIRSPFLRIPMPQYIGNIKNVKELIKKIGSDGFEIDKEIAPLIFVFTGKGNVSKGAQEIFKLFPHEWIEPKDLKRFFDSGSGRRDVIYGCVVEAKDYIKPLKKKKGVVKEEFNYSEYLKYPERFESKFNELFLPYTSVLINGIYWEQKYPKLLTKADLYKFLGQKIKTISIADISCDINGSIELTDHSSSIDEPFYYFNIKNKNYSDKTSDEDSVQIMSIDNLPTQLPEDSSKHFGQQLTPIIPYLLGIKQDNQVLATAVENAKITDHGDITEKFSFLKDKLENIKRVLILGSGHVVPPAIQYLYGSDVEITIGTNAFEEAKSQYKHMYKDISIVELDVTKDRKLLESLIESSDIVISLVTANLHIPIAETCINLGKNMVTASYISPDMQDLNEAAMRAGVLLLNEIGLDPGLDHLAAKDIIDKSHQDGYEIESFTSWCGGLPAPEHADNPFKYKFSWSPLGVLTATQNDAKYLKNGKVVEIDGKNLLKSVQSCVDIHPIIKFEGIPNRNSLKYISLYGIEEVSTMFRGTLRYQGFCNVIDRFKDLGFFSNLIQNPEETPLKITKQIIALESKLYLKDHPNILKTLRWLGALENKYDENLRNWFYTPIDFFCSLLEKKLKYKEKERDLVFLHHEFIVKSKVSKERKRITATLCEYGDQPTGHSAMSRTVGIPVAVAARLILEKKIISTGVKAPLEKSIYQPILSELTENCGLKFVIKEEVL